MKIRKFIAEDIRKVIKMVRDEQGSDAIIISNRRVSDGVEIVSAIDYDDSSLSQLNIDSCNIRESGKNNGKINSLAPESSHSDDTHYLGSQNKQRDNGDNTDRNSIHDFHRKGDSIDNKLFTEMRRELSYLRNIIENRILDVEWPSYSKSNPIKAEVIKRLLKLNLSSELVQEIVNELPFTDKLETAWNNTMINIGDRLHLADYDVADKGGVIALVGTTGVGKTTTVAKLAARYALHRGARHAAMISTDSYRVSAHGQLRTYGRLLDMPVRITLKNDDLQMHLAGLLDKELILIDTAGISQRDMRMSEQLSFLRESMINMKVYLVLEATNQLVGLEETINVFRDVGLDGCILTKLDEAITIGPAFSAIIKQKLPLVYVSDGQNVPEDLHVAKVDKLINQETFNTIWRKETSIRESMAFSMGRTATNAH